MQLHYQSTKPLCLVIFYFVFNERAHTFGCYDHYFELEHTFWICDIVYWENVHFKRKALFFEVSESSHWETKTEDLV